MDIANPLVLIPISASPIFIVAGVILYLRPPKNINQVYGYRTKRSMSSQEAWKYAQPEAGKQLIYFGLTYLSTSFLGKLLPDVGEVWSALITIGLMCVGLFGLFRKMEVSLKNRVD